MSSAAHRWRASISLPLTPDQKPESQQLCTEQVLFLPEWWLGTNKRTPPAFLGVPQSPLGALSWSVSPALIPAEDLEVVFVLSIWVRNGAVSCSHFRDTKPPLPPTVFRTALLFFSSDFPVRVCWLALSCCSGPCLSCWRIFQMLTILVCVFMTKSWSHKAVWKVVSTLSLFVASPDGPFGVDPMLPPF